MGDGSTGFSPDYRISHGIGIFAALISSLRSPQNGLASFLGGFFAYSLVSWGLPYTICQMGRKKLTKSMYQWRFFCATVVGSVFVIWVAFS
jgi:hypothetical protein